MHPETETGPSVVQHGVVQRRICAGSSQRVKRGDASHVTTDPDGEWPSVKAGGGVEVA